MVNTVEQAVPLVMRERGYEQKGTFINRRDWWYKSSEVVTPKEALASCLSLDVLADEVWVKQWRVEADLKNKKVIILDELSGQVALGLGKTIHDAALIATGRALEAKK
jgi:hypothetical protein